MKILTTGGELTKNNCPSLPKQQSAVNGILKKVMKNLKALFIFSLFFIFSCNNRESSDKENLPSVNINSESTSARLSEGCPEGTHAVWSYSFDEFHFHRPKYNCDRGFWFCTKGGSGWTVECVPNGSTAPVSTISEGKARVWAKEVDGKIELHFPLALKDTEGYTPEDLATFNVDEEYEIYNGITLKTGDYPVQQTENELVVLVDLL